MANMTHIIKIGDIVAEIVTTTNEGFCCRWSGRLFRLQMNGARKATLIGRDMSTGRMKSMQVRV
jgi:hypothetical protein